MVRQLPQRGRRVSLRRVREDGAIGDIVGFVRHATATGLTIRDRHGQVHTLGWDEVLAWRQIGVARGRDPLRTPLGELDTLAVAAGVHGRVFVARLSDLLDAADTPADPDLDTLPPHPAVISGEWVSAGSTDDLLALAWWASHHDARSIQVRTDDPDDVDRLLTAGFTERTDRTGSGEPCLTD